MSAADGRTSPVSSYRIGTKPSHLAARSIGRWFGRIPATQTGIRGRCTGVGVNRTGSIVNFSPE